MTIYPCSEANSKKFQTFESSPKLLNLQGKELMDPKAAEALVARKVAEVKHWKAVKKAAQEKSEKKNSLTFPVYAALPPSVQDKNQLVKDGVKKHVQDQLQAFFPNCDISSCWAMTPHGGNRLCAQFFLVDRQGRKPKNFLNFGDRPITLPNGTTLRPLTDIKYIDVEGPHPVETNFPKTFLDDMNVKQCCYKPKTLAEGVPNLCWRSLRSTCGRKDYWYDTWRNNNK